MMADNNNSTSSDDITGQQQEQEQEYIIILKETVLVLLPIVSLVYSIGCSSLVYISGEYAGCTIKSKLIDLLVPIIIQILLVFVVFVLGRYFSDWSNDSNRSFSKRYWIRYVITLLVSIRLSYKLIKQTKYQFVDGGPNPLILDYNNNNNNNEQYAFNNSTENLVIIITGANTGIGKETAIQLALLGSTRRPPNVITTIILACRTVSKALVVKKEIEQLLQQTSASSSSSSTSSSTVIIEVIELELCSYQSIRVAVSTIINKYKIIHCLINNAGVMMNKYTTTIDSNETTIQANHLGHFLLTCLLLPYIVPNDVYQQPPQTSRTISIQYVPRIINLTSSTYSIAKHLPVHDLNCSSSTSTSHRRTYTMFTQYSISKLCNILFTKGIKYQFPSTIFVAAVHPGCVRTDVVRNMPSFLQIGNYLFGTIIQTMQKTPTQGAWCTTYISALLADTTPPNSGQYWLNRHVHPIQYNNTNTNNNSNQSTIQDDAIELWYESCRLVQLTDEEIQRIESIATIGLQRRRLVQPQQQTTAATTSSTEISSNTCTSTINDSKKIQ